MHEIKSLLPRRGACSASPQLCLMQCVHYYEKETGGFYGGSSFKTSPTLVNTGEGYTVRYCQAGATLTRTRRREVCVSEKIVPMWQFFPFIRGLLQRPNPLVRWATLILLACLLETPQVFSSTITVGFEGFADGTVITTQYSGLIFSNATIATAGISLNEFEFPPHSGMNVVFDDGGPITIDFATPVLSFGGYFTYSVPLTVDAFNVTSSVVASATSAFSNNEALSGDPGSSPNEFLQVSFASGISDVTITGSLTGGSFVLDDATITTSVSTVPESSTLILAVIGAAMLMLFGMRMWTKSEG